MSKKQPIQTPRWKSPYKVTGNKPNSGDTYTPLIDGVVGEKCGEFKPLVNLYEEIVTDSGQKCEIDDLKLLEELDEVLQRQQNTSHFLPETIEMLQIYASRGLSDDSLAMMLGVDIDEFRVLRATDPCIERAIIKGRLPLVHAINITMWKLATGRMPVTVKRFLNSPDGIETEVTTTTGKIDFKTLRLLAKNFAGYVDDPYVSEKDRMLQKQKDQEIALRAL